MDVRTTLSDEGIREIVVLMEMSSQASSQAVWGILRSIADGSRARWQQLASERLTTTRGAYLKGLQPVVGDKTKMTASISLVGTLANMVEQGASAMDLHDAFLSEGKGKMSANGGRYRVIPFRHATPGSTSFQGGLPMGQPYGSAAAGIGKAIYGAAKKLAPSVQEQAGGRVQWGGRLPGGLAPMLKPYPQHLTDIYQGMYRQSKTYEKARGSQYITFRTISVDGAGGAAPPGTWLHPGIEPVGLADQVNEYIEQIALPAMVAYLGGGA